MSQEKKIRLLTWAVIVLAIMGLSVMATIVYHLNFSRNSMSTHYGRFAGSWRGRDMLEEMNFSERQRMEFKKINDRFREDVEGIDAGLGLKREALFSEINAPVTDTVKCEVIATEIGALHRALKIKTYRFYLDLKKICTPDQKEKLKDVFAPVFDMGEGRGQGHRGGGRHRWCER